MLKDLLSPTFAILATLQKKDKQKPNTINIREIFQSQKLYVIMVMEILEEHQQNSL